jgi:hypothetical protein
MHFRTTGTGKRGFPLIETTTIYGPDGSAMSTITKEVTELSKATLDQALFEIPQGYTEAHDATELYAFGGMGGGNPGRGARPPVQTASETTASANTESTGAGKIRIGVVRLGNKTDQNVSTDSLRDRLVSAIEESGIEAVPLDSLLASEAPKEAKQKHCGFILYSDVTTMKPASAAKKVGGLLGRATGIGGGGGAGKSEAQINFRLLPVDNLTPVIQSSASAKEDGDEATITSALEQEAHQVVQSAMRKH